MHKSISTLALLAPLALTAAKAEKPNMLFIAVDDLREDLGCYGNKQVVSPNIDALAKKGVQFTQAYVQVAVCNPCRASIMTGLRPDSTKVWDLGPHLRERIPNAVTIPQYLRKYNYHAVGLGKIFHNPYPDPQSWSEPLWQPTNLAKSYSKKTLERYKEKRMSFPPDSWGRNAMRCNSTASPDIADENTYDGANTLRAIQYMKELKNKEKPFFIAMGYVRPHLPFVPPKKYWDLYKREEIKLAENDYLPKNTTPLSFFGSAEFPIYMDMRNMPNEYKGKIDDNTARRLKHGYYASVSFVDAQIGKLLQALKDEGLEENTIVVFWSDHGYKLGEHRAWGKMSNHEIDCRIPFIIYDPRSDVNGTKCNKLVELVDVYPTLCDLAGIPVPKKLEGNSMKPLLTGNATNWKTAAFSQYERLHKGTYYMGYTVKTPNARYVEWRSEKDGAVKWTEFYDHSVDPQENSNVSSEDSYAEAVREHAEILSKKHPRRALKRQCGIRSINSGVKAELKLVNKLQSVIDVYWVDQRGIRRRNGVIASGKTYIRKTQLGHAFVVESRDGKFHRIVYPDSTKRAINLYN